MKSIAANARRGGPKAEIILMRIFIILLAAIFVVAGVEKGSARADFEAALIRMELFPDGMISLIAVGIPLLEIVLGLMCLIASTARRGLQGLATLTALYTLLLSYEWMRGIDIGCGCFGAQSADWPHWALVLRNLGLLLLEACLLRRQWQPYATAPGLTAQLRSEAL